MLLRPPCLIVDTEMRLPCTGSPGRFFAANELKAMLAYIVINYDLKMAGNGERPKNIYWAHSVLPSPSGEVSFRMRKASM